MLVLVSPYELASNYHSCMQMVAGIFSNNPKKKKQSDLSCVPCNQINKINLKELTNINLQLPVK